MGKKKKAEMENIKLYFKHSPSSRAGFACLNRSDANVCGQWAARSIGVLIFGALHPPGILLASFWPGITWPGPLEDFCPLHMACIMNGNVSESLFARPNPMRLFLQFNFPFQLRFILLVLAPAMLITMRNKSAICGHIVGEHYSGTS